MFCLTLYRREPVSILTSVLKKTQEFIIKHSCRLFSNVLLLTCYGRSFEILFEYLIVDELLGLQKISKLHRKKKTVHVYYSWLHIQIRKEAIAT